jgi:hypothetical protein
MTSQTNTALRGRRAALVALLMAALSPAVAHAETVEMSDYDDAVSASCPDDPCRAMTRTTGFQKRVAGVEDVFTVPKNGRIVAWSVQLGTPSPKQEKFFEDNFGGTPQANVTVFRVGTKKPNKGIGTNIGQSGPQQLAGYYGQTVQFAMINPVRVHKGDRVALTTATWAPVLAENEATNTVWRATRPADSCGDYSAQRAIRQLGTMTPFECQYKTERQLYGVTMITEPVPNKVPKKPKPKT